MFSEFKEAELKERADLLRSQLKASDGNSAQEQQRRRLLLPRLSQTVLLPRPQEEDTGPVAQGFAGSTMTPSSSSSSPASRPLDADALVEQLKSSFGLAPLLKHGKATAAEVSASLGRALKTKRQGGQLLELTRLFAEPSLPLKLEVCSGDGHWVCAQALADKGRANWACMELQK